MASLGVATGVGVESRSLIISAFWFVAVCFGVSTVMAFHTHHLGYFHVRKSYLQAVQDYFSVVASTKGCHMEAVVTK